MSLHRQREMYFEDGQQAAQQGLRRRRSSASHDHGAVVPGAVHDGSLSQSSEAGLGPGRSTSTSTSTDLALTRLPHVRFRDENDPATSTYLTRSTRGTAALSRVPQENNDDNIDPARSRFLHQLGQHNLSVVNNNNTTNNYRIGPVEVVSSSHRGGGSDGDGVVLPSSREYRKLKEEQRQQKQRRGIQSKPSWWHRLRACCRCRCRGFCCGGIPCALLVFCLVGIMLLILLLLSFGGGGDILTTRHVGSDVVSSSTAGTVRATSLSLPVASSPGILTGRSRRRGRVDAQEQGEQGHPYAQQQQQQQQQPREAPQHNTQTRPVSDETVRVRNEAILSMLTGVDAFSRQLATSCMCAGPQVLLGLVEERDENQEEQGRFSSLTMLLRDFCIAPKPCEEDKSTPLQAQGCSYIGSGGSGQEWHFHRFRAAYARVDGVLLDNDDTHRAVEAARDELGKLEGMYEEELATQGSQTHMHTHTHTHTRRHQDSTNQASSWGAAIHRHLPLWLVERLLTSDGTSPQSIAIDAEQERRILRQETAARLLVKTETALVSSLNRLKGLRDGLGDLVSALDNSAYLSGEIEGGLSRYEQEERERRPPNKVVADVEAEAKADLRQLFFMSWYQGQNAAKVCYKEEVTVGDAVTKLWGQLRKVRRLIKEKGDQAEDESAGDVGHNRHRQQGSGGEVRGGLGRKDWLEVVERVADVLDEVERWDSAFVRQVGE